MLKRCEYCNNYYDDCLEKCDSCGSVNDSIRRTADKVPQTIDELIDYCKTANIPARELRFFIGEDCKESKTFGIYKDESSGNIIVYKNKDNGQRAIRYQGTDEKYAVNEIYQKLKEILIIARKKNNNSKKGTNTNKYKNKNVYKKHYHFLSIFFKILSVLWVAFPCILIFIGIYLSSSNPKIGKYTINDDTYYYENGYWFDYDTITNDITYNPNFSIDFGTDTYTYESSNLEISSYLSEILGEGNYDYEESYSSSSSWSDYDWDDSDWDSDWSDSSYDYDYSYDWSSDW